MPNSTVLTNKTLAIIATDGFEQSELLDPKHELEARGAKTHVISINGNQTIRAWDQKDWGKIVSVDKQIEDLNLSDYDGIILPGGQMNPDILRTNKNVVACIKSAADQNHIKFIAAICHGPWLLIEADLVKSKNVTSYPSIRTDLINAGGNWQDRTVVVDGKLITSRNPDDIANFIDAITQKLSS